jgi:hypothetical protein
MIRRAWKSRHFANVVALMALFVALGGTGLAQSGGALSIDEIRHAFTREQYKITGAMIREGTITSRHIRSNTVTGKDIKTGSVEGKDIKSGTVDSIDIRPKAVTYSKIANKSVGTAQLVDHAIGDTQVAPNALTTRSINEPTLTLPRRCSNGKIGPIGDICATVSVVSAGTWAAAQSACVASGMRLPSIAELLRTLDAAPIPGVELWTDQPNGAVGSGDHITVKRTPIPPNPPLTDYLARTSADNIAFRCVVTASSDT